jgi:hypothetical protein
VLTTATPPFRWRVLLDGYQKTRCCEHKRPKTPPRDQKTRWCERFFAIHEQIVFTASSFLVEEGAKRPLMFTTSRFLVDHWRVMGRAWPRRSWVASGRPCEGASVTVRGHRAGSLYQRHKILACRRRRQKTVPIRPSRRQPDDFVSDHLFVRCPTNWMRFRPGA